MQVNVMLLSAAAATGAAISVGRGGDYCFAANGTFGGTSVGLEMLGPDGVNYISVEDADGAIALTTAGAVLVSLPAGSYRATITGGAAVVMSASLKSV